MKWFYQTVDKRALWYYNMEPCEVVALGVREGHKNPCVLRIKQKDAILEVIARKDGFPGMTYVVEPCITEIKTLL
jgi:hypothetical protein